MSKSLDAAVLGTLMVFGLLALQTQGAFGAATMPATGTETAAAVMAAPIVTPIPQAQTSGTVADCVINTTLSLGSTGSNVSCLQQTLAKDPSVYPEGLVTGYFGPLTQKAVQRWQAAHNIVSSGDAEGTGFGAVGPRTRASFEGSSTGVSTTLTCPVYQTTACSAGTHRVDGAPTYDSNNCAVPHWSCDADTAPTSPTQPTSDATPVTNNASSTTNGTSSTLVCPVYQTTACPSGTHRVDSAATYDDKGCATPHWSCVADTASTFSATPTSGAAPLAVRLTATGLDSSGSYSVTFGDGTSGQGSCSLTSTSVCTQGTLYFNHTYTTAGTYTATLQSTCSSGSADSNACSVKSFGTATVTVTGGSNAPSDRGAQSFDPAGMVASAVMAPFGLMIDSLTNIFVMLGVGQ